MPACVLVMDSRTRMSRIGTPTGRNTEHVDDRREITLSQGHYSRMRGRPRWRTARGLTAGLVSVAATTAFLATGGAAQAVPGTRPVEAAGIVPQGAMRIGTLPTSTTLHFDVVLSPRNPAALTKYADAVSTPGSPRYPRSCAGLRSGLARRR